MKTIESLKDTYRNQRVFIIGNGPSLRKTPLDLMKNDYSIAMNRIALLYGSTTWHPNLFICTTTNIEREEWRNDILKTLDLGIPSFVWDELRDFIGNRENVYYIRCSHGKEKTSNAPLEWWSNDISKRVCKFGTSMLVAFQVAVFLGFNPIYIVGADLGYKETMVQKILRQDFVKDLTFKLGVSEEKLKKISFRFDRNHFSSSYGTPGSSPKILNENMLAAHELARVSAKKQGVRIFNATIGGELNVYPRVDYYDLFKSSQK